MKLELIDRLENYNRKYFLFSKKQNKSLKYFLVNNFMTT